VITATPAVSTVLDDLYVPLLNTTVPVGVAFPLVALIVTVAVIACAVVMLDSESPMLIPGAGREFTVTDPVPDALV
jgi:hypothetical protein